MRLKTKVLLSCVAITCLAGCKESREDKIGRLFPIERAYAGSVLGSIRGLHAETNWPHVPEPMVSSIVMKHTDTESVRAALAAMYTEKNYSDEELDYIAFMGREPLKAYNEDKERLRLASMKRYEVSMALWKDPLLKAAADRSIEAMRADLDQAEKAVLDHR